MSAETRARMDSYRGWIQLLLTILTPALIIVFNYKVDQRVDSKLKEHATEESRQISLALTQAQTALKNAETVSATVASRVERDRTNPYLEISRYEREQKTADEMNKLWRDNVGQRFTAIEMGLRDQSSLTTTLKDKINDVDRKTDVMNQKIDGIKELLQKKMP